MSEQRAGRPASVNSSAKEPRAANASQPDYLGLSRVYEADGQRITFAPDGEGFTVFTQSLGERPGYPG